MIKIFENLMILGWFEVLCIVLASVGVCTAIILLMDIWMNREWTPIVRATKYKRVQTDIDEQGNPIFEKVAYRAIVDFGTWRSVVSGILLGIFYSLAALIGLGEVVMTTNMFGKINDIWTIRIVPIIFCVFVGFFSNIFWKLIYWIGRKLEKVINNWRKGEGLEEDKESKAPTVDSKNVGNDTNKIETEESQPAKSPEEKTVEIPTETQTSQEETPKVVSTVTRISDRESVTSYDVKTEEPKKEEPSEKIEVGTI